MLNIYYIGILWLLCDSGNYNWKSMARQPWCNLQVEIRGFLVMVGFTIADSW